MRQDGLAKAYFEYDPDKDPNGSIGIGIVEAIFKKCNYNSDKLHKWIILQKLRRTLEKSVFDL